MRLPAFLSKIVPVLVILLLMSTLGAASAATGSELAFSVGCDGFSSRGGSIHFDGETAVVVRAYDAAGTVLYSSRIARPASGTYPFASGQTAWSTAPEFNPIVFSIVTEAESIADTELVHLVVGSCGTLPTLADAYEVTAELGLLDLLASADGRTSPSVPLGGIPPRPETENDIIGTLSGYALVNTDNLFVRSGPGVQYTVVGIVDGGTYLIVLGRNEEGLADSSTDLWWYIEVGDLRGWVNSAFLALRGDLTAVEVVPVQGEIQQPSVYIGFTGLPLLDSPSEGAAWACGVRGDSFYPVLARDTRPANWLYIEAVCVDGSTRRGWMPLESVIYRNPGDVDLPVR